MCCTTDIYLLSGILISYLRLWSFSHHMYFSAIAALMQYFIRWYLVRIIVLIFKHGLFSSKQHNIRKICTRDSEWNIKKILVIKHVAATCPVFEFIVSRWSPLFNLYRSIYIIDFVSPRSPGVGLILLFLLYLCYFIFTHRLFKKVEIKINSVVIAWIDLVQEQINRRQIFPLDQSLLGSIVCLCVCVCGHKRFDLLYHLWYVLFCLYIFLLFIFSVWFVLFRIFLLIGIVIKK